MLNTHGPTRNTKAAINNVAAYPEILRGLIDTNVDIKVILPSTLKNVYSTIQLNEWTKKRLDNQIESANKSFDQIEETLSSYSGGEVKRYRGAMYENIIILDDVAIIAFYNTTGSGSSNWTLRFVGSASEGVRYAEDEFQRMWG